MAISVNGLLPKDVCVKNLYVVGDDFHARYRAARREYLYLIHNHPLRSPFSEFRMMWVKMKLDIDAMKEAASYLIGEHDFASFCKKVSANEGTVRRIHEIDIARHGEVVFIRISGTAFLHNQIRATVGTLINMQKYDMPPSFMTEILSGRDRDAAGFTAPAHGLYLSKIDYDPALDSYPAAFESHDAGTSFMPVF